MLSASAAARCAHAGRAEEADTDAAATIGRYSVRSKRSLAALLARNGFIAAQDEARTLWNAAGGDPVCLEHMARRRLTGEPLAWIVGRTTFCGVSLRVDPGVYVPRLQTELIAERALARLPEEGVAIDMCTGSGAIAVMLQARRPHARVIACDIDVASVACARANGADAYVGELFEAVPEGFERAVDVVVAVAPYVPTSELPLLQRDTFTFETRLAYDGGVDGAAMLRLVAHEARRFLRPHGALVLELGGTQDRIMREELSHLGYGDLHLHHDEDGDLRGIEATWRPATEEVTERVP